MQQFKLALSLIIMVPAWALLGGFARLDSPEPRKVAGGMAVGALIGIFFGLIFSGVNGKWLDFISGSELPCDGTKKPANGARDLNA